MASHPEPTIDPTKPITIINIGALAAAIDAAIVATAGKVYDDDNSDNPADYPHTPAA